MVIVPLFNGLVQFRSLPILSAVDAHVDTFNLATATTPGDSFQGNVRSILGTDRGILRWVANEGSHGLFVDDGSLIETGWRPIGQVLFKSYVGGKSTVRFALVAFLGLFVAESNLFEPFNLPSAYVTGNDHANRVTVVTRELFVVPVGE
jgi:hypothetical protein